MRVIELADTTILSGVEAWTKLEQLIQGGSWSRVAVLVDEHTRDLCLPALRLLLPSLDLIEINISSGEKNKNLLTCEQIWKTMLDNQMDRKSLLLNLGGGVIGDMGGFCASTFMRGIDFVQIPTTLLSMVDASVGSKLGIDFRGLKNIIGLFNDPDLVMIHPEFLKTLSKGELRSGYAEMLKHLLIADAESWKNFLAADNWRDNINHDTIFASVSIKKRFVEEDPLEQGVRKALNYGHTVGHAIESICLVHEDLPNLKHGEAVALGMIIANIVAREKGMLSKTDMEEINDYLLSVYKAIKIPKRFWGNILSMVLHDKKNVAGVIKMTLLTDIGDVKVNIDVSPEEIRFALSAYNALVAANKVKK